MMTRWLQVDLKFYLRFMSKPEIRTNTDRITLSDGAEVATTTLEPPDRERTGQYSDHRDRLGASAVGVSNLSAEWLAVLSAPWCTDTGQAAFYRQIAALLRKHTAPIVDRLGEVRCPVRIGWGEDDPWIPADQAGRLAEALPGCPEVTRFPHSGHLVPLEAPSDFLADVTA